MCACSKRGIGLVRMTRARLFGSRDDTITGHLITTASRNAFCGAISEPKYKAFKSIFMCIQMLYIIAKELFDIIFPILPRTRYRKEDVHVRQCIVAMAVSFESVSSFA